MKKTIVASLAVAAAFAITAPANATTVLQVQPVPYLIPRVILGLRLTACLVHRSRMARSVPSVPLLTMAPISAASGMIMLNTPGGTGGSLGLYAEPFHDTSNYLTVQPAGSPETIALNTTATRFELYWGSMDTYNSIQFYRNGGLIDTVTGSQAAAVVPALATAIKRTMRPIDISKFRLLEMVWALIP